MDESAPREMDHRWGSAQENGTTRQRHVLSAAISRSAAKAPLEVLVRGKLEKPPEVGVGGPA